MAMERWPYRFAPGCESNQGISMWLARQILKGRKREGVCVCVGGDGRRERDRDWKRDKEERERQL